LAKISGDLVVASLLRAFFENAGRLATEHHCGFMKFIGDGFLAAFDQADQVLPFASAVQAVTGSDFLGRKGPIGLQAWEQRSVPTSHQLSPRIACGRLPGFTIAPGYAAAYSWPRTRIAQAIRAVLLARATTPRFTPRRATTAFSHSERRSWWFDNR
jgi:class 3 adenylate cyclase